MSDRRLQNCKSTTIIKHSLFGPSVELSASGRAAEMIQGVMSAGPCLGGTAAVAALEPILAAAFDDGVGRLGAAAQGDVAASRAEWEVVNTLLPAICEPDILAETLWSEAWLFAKFTAQTRDEQGLALPVEAVALAWAMMPQLVRARSDSLPDPLSAPSAQACLDALEFAAVPLPRLCPAELRTGELGALIERLDAVQDTPLVLYLWQEASRFGGHSRLGPLGSTILAEVLAGRIIQDKASYWNQPGLDGGRWYPQDNVFPSGGGSVGPDSSIRLAMTA